MKKLGNGCLDVCKGNETNARAKKNLNQSMFPQLSNQGVIYLQKMLLHFPTRRS